MHSFLCVSSEVFQYTYRAAFVSLFVVVVVVVVVVVNFLFCFVLFSL